MPDAARQLVHATAIVVDGRAALIIGPSGAGKSDLALRAIMGPVMLDGRLHAAILLADDQVLVERPGECCLIAHAPPSTAGRMEVRGLGIVQLPFVQQAPVALVARIAALGETIERLPDPAPRHRLLGVDLPEVALSLRDTSAHLKLMLALLRSHGA